MLRLAGLRARGNLACLRRPFFNTIDCGRAFFRWQTTVVSSPSLTPVSAHPVSSSASWDADDSQLRSLFDNPHLETKPTILLHQNVGLFRNRYLTNPAGFDTFAKLTVTRARRLVDEVLAAETVEELKAVVILMDRLSDLLCRVLDLSDFVRASHPDHKIQKAAENAWGYVYHYMNELNTEPGLCNQLGRAMDHPDVARHWNEEEMSAAQALKMDFMKSAVALPQGSRDSFVEISQQISQVGTKFITEMEPAENWLRFPPSIVQNSSFAKAHRVLNAFGADAREGLVWCPEEEVRKQIFYAMRSASKATVQNLESLVYCRAQLAHFTQFESYSHLALRDRMMAKTPASVFRFLRTINQRNAPSVVKEIKLLHDYKHREVSSNGGDSMLQPWDKDYYMNKAAIDAFGHNITSGLEDFFSLGVVMRGLSRMFTKLFGIRFVPAETAPGETWSPEVRRLDVLSDTEGHVAVLYCDLFHRRNKHPNPAHFTVRCSREIAPREMKEFETGSAFHGFHSTDLPVFESAEQAANDGMSTSWYEGKLKQLPTIALVCDFMPRGSKCAPLLGWHEVETLFHEMGHAIHSILARTSLQNVAGTRCPTDMAELPSTLFEHFASNQDVLNLFAEHRVTGEPVPMEMIQKQVDSMNQFSAIETERQIFLAMYDQALYSMTLEEMGVGGVELDSTQLYHELQRKHTLMPPDPPGTTWQGFVGHLFSYGATYYSYIFDRVLAERVWRVVFNSGKEGRAIDRHYGERLKQGILKWGGSRDPWHMLADTLEDETIRAGDEKAMERVGSWGLGAR